MQFRLLILISLISLISVTGLYAYALTLDITPIAQIDNDDDSETLLDGPMDIAITTIGGSTYAVVSSNKDHGIEIIDISDPTNPTSVSRVADDTSKLLKNANGNAITTIGGNTYVVVASNEDDGIQIIDISNPTSPTAVGKLEDDGNSACTAEPSLAEGTKCLDGAREVAIYTTSGSTYAVVAARDDDGIEIIDISDPTNPTSVGRLTETDDTNRELNGAKGVAIETINGTPYAVVGSMHDDGIQIIDISDPTNPTAVGSLDDEDGGINDTGECTVEERCLEGAKGVAIETINGTPYAFVAGQNDDGIEIIDISDPTNPTSVSRVVDTGTTQCTVENGERCLDGVRQMTTAQVGDIGATSGTYYLITVGKADDGVGIINISDPENPRYVASLTHTDPSCSGSDCELDGPSYVAPISTIGSSTYVLVASEIDDGIQIFRLCENCEVIATTSSTASTSASSSTCARLVILGNCGTIGINNDEYQIIDPWSTIPTTEVVVGEPVSITLSTPHNHAAGKINSASIYTEIFGSPRNYELGSHIDYSVMESDYYVSESELFQVVGATHRIVQDTNVKNLEMFEVVFTMIFAKPMDTSHIVVETNNMHGIPETIYLGNALKVIERPIELLTYEEKSKFELISEPELKVSLRYDMGIESDMDILTVDPEPVVSKVTCGYGTMLKDNLCVSNEMSFYFFIKQFMRIFS